MAITGRLVAVAVSIFTLAAAGCGGSKPPAPTGGGDLALFKIESGSYTVANLVDGGDGCAVGLTAANFTTLTVRNDGQGDLNLGDFRSTSGALPHFEPGAYSAGSGHFSDSTHGMTLLQTHVTASDDPTPCSYDETLTTTLTVTGSDQLHVVLNHRDSDISACTTPPGSSCTSSFTFDLTFVPPVDLGVR